MKKMSAWIFSLGGLALLAGCSQQTLNSAQHDAQRDAAVVSREAQRAANHAGPQINKARLGGRVTAALQAADVRGVRVDAGPDGVTLVGRVDSQEAKARALHIAQDTLGPGKTVHSRIAVDGRQ